MAEAVEMNKQIKDITAFPICSEVYTDPKVLPCIHTFCLKCLTKWGEDKLPGEQISCPLCRKEFKIPDSGLVDFPTNFFIAKLLDIKIVSITATKEATSNTTKETTLYCDWCDDDKERKELASMYCINCQQCACNSCSNSDIKTKFTKSHKIIQIENWIQRHDLLKISPSYCNQHHDKTLALYCFDCDAAICTMCFVEVHKLHNCSNIDKVAEDFIDRIKVDLANVADKISKNKYNAKQLSEVNFKFSANIK